VLGLATEPRRLFPFHHPSSETKRNQTNEHSRPAERPPIANDPAPAQAFGVGVETGEQAAVTREQRPGSYGRTE
jgi:hypothetical protein